MNKNDKCPKRRLSTNDKNGQEGKNQNKNPVEESNWPIPSMEDSDWVLFTQIDTQRTIVASPLITRYHPVAASEPILSFGNSEEAHANHDEANTEATADRATRNFQRKAHMPKLCVAFPKLHRS